MNKEKNKRREFVKQLCALSVGGMISPRVIQAGTNLRNNDDIKKKAANGLTVLFQGDSITDGNRSRDNDWNHVMGHGYQFIISCKLWYELPQKRLEFVNRGISGNTVTDLLSRWQRDTIELKPDVLSILIGINDVSGLIGGNKSFTAEAYEDKYRNLLEQTNQQLPNIQFVLCEPFLLPVGIIKDNWEPYEMEVKKRRQVVKQLSEEYNAVFIPFQDAFNKALAKAPPDYWIWDGIHPMPAGHELMAREWLKQVSKKFKFIR